MHKKTLSLPNSVEIFEVGPRDGLQNEPLPLDLQAKLNYIHSLIKAGIKNIEAGSFVRADKIPQMKNSDLLFNKLPKTKGVTFWAAVPNEKGLDRALESKCRAIAVFTGATNTFTQKNIGMTMKKSIQVFSKVIKRAHQNQCRVRGYVSVGWGCPYEGKVSKTAFLRQIRALIDIGVEQVSLGDTIGVATPLEVVSVLEGLKPQIRAGKIAAHFHDTRGTALANCLVAVGSGVKTLDSSSAGLGGCNYAPGASGNVATEDLVYMLHGMKVKTGIDLDKLCKASLLAVKSLGRVPTSRYLQSWLSKKHLLL